MKSCVVMNVNSLEYVLPEELSKAELSLFTYVIYDAYRKQVPIEFYVKSRGVCIQRYSIQKFLNFFKMSTELFDVMDFVCRVHNFYFHKYKRKSFLKKILNRG